LNTIQRKLILASKSPRRSFLLKQAGFEFEVNAVDIDENDYPSDLPVAEVASYLAREKARAARHFITNDEIIIASDSVVIVGNEIFGKPADYNDAVRILQALSGRMHLVITGVCLLSNEKEEVFSDVAKVHFDTLSTAEIDYYIQNYQPYDKAGAYAIQEWIGLCKILKIEGTYTNIMGLPVHLVYQKLQSF
jgi:septum formation protein